MTIATNAFHRLGRIGRPVVLCSLALGLMLISGMSRAEEQTAAPIRPNIEALAPGEILTYNITWSNIVTAGTATTEIREGTLPDGKQVLLFIVTTHSAGLVDTFYRVNDRLESVFDPGIMQSLKFTLKESHGKRTRNRGLVFDHINKTVISTLNQDPPEILKIPDQVQDALSSLYYLRTLEEFIVGKPITIQVHDSGKNWSVEVQTLGREKVTTPAGEFATIKVRTFPRYEGVFMNKGEIFIWLTDDNRKIPVLMKSTIAIGSIVSTLTKIKLRKDIHDGDNEVSSKPPLGTLP
jgi:Protein of unknown function (DUF3108)